MDSPSLELVDDSHIYISGEVIVHPSAAIAPGVLLQADPGSRLTIAAGVCIGQGSVLHAHQGTLEIQTGAILGSGVLIVGQGKIGAYACIGALTTIIHSSVEPDQSVPPHSLIGDTSRQLSDTAHTATPATPTVSSIDPLADPWTDSPPPATTFNSNFYKHDLTQPEQPKPKQPKPEQPKPEPATSKAPAAKAMTQVYGQAYVERIMITMFPHRRMLDSSEQDTPNHSNSNSSPPGPP